MVKKMTTGKNTILKIAHVLSYVLKIVVLLGVASYSLYKYN